MASTGLTHVLCCEASFAQRSSGFRVGSFDLGFSFPGSKSEFRFGGLGFRVYPVIVGPESLHIKDRFEQWSVFRLGSTNTRINGGLGCRGHYLP